MIRRLATYAVVAVVLAIVLTTVLTSATPPADDFTARNAKRVADAFRAERAQVETVIVESVQRRTHYRTVRDTLLVRLPADTQPVPRAQVDSLIAAADAMDATCAEMELRCALALAKADTLNRLNVQQIGAERRRGRKRALVMGLVGVGIGAVAWEVIR